MNRKFTGLSTTEVESSRKEHGTNSFDKVKSRGILRRFFDNLCDPIIRILLIALALEVIFTFGNCNLLEVFGIVIAVLIATVVSTVSEYGSETAFRKMQEANRSGKIRAYRNGVLTELPIDELVFGDIILLSAGESVPADCVLLSGQLFCDQSALNGENTEAEKVSGKNAEMKLDSPSSVFRGSIVSSGKGVLRVVRVGKDTLYGMVAKDVQAQVRKSPLKLRLEQLAKSISRLGYACAALVGILYLFTVLVVDRGFVMANIIEGLTDFRFLFTSLTHALTLMITVIVVAVPEGLPMMITVVLAANMKKMLKDNVLVKKLVGIETSGSLNILFTDKTGTLTTGRLSLDRIITAGGEYKTERQVRSLGTLCDLLTENAFYNTEVENTDKGALGGNSTDRAIAEFFKNFRPPRSTVLSHTPFSSETKMSSVKLSSGRCIIKGAPEIILPRIKSALLESGEVVMTDLATVNQKNREATTAGQRVIAVAEENADGSLTFIALIVLKDKLRQGVREAVKEMLCAGIQVVMVTGDNKATAEGIAEECGFYKRSRGDIAITSDELSKMTDGELSEIMPRLRVVARALPQDKTRLVKVAQSLELVTGMTGDGINDAPSLKLADIGFSMGSGTDIAKGAGDIIILDNSFTAICSAVLYGRTIFKSIRRFITFQLIMNLAACGITLIGRFIGFDTPITIIQMLWVNIIMDTLGGLAFAGEAPIRYYMKERPKRRDEPIIVRETLYKILLNGTYTLLLLIVFLSHGFFRGIYQNMAHHLTAFYALFIFAGLFNCLCARSERLFIFTGILKNKLFIAILLFISIIQLLIIYFGGTLFRSTPLSLTELLWAIGTASTVLIFDCIVRVFKKMK